MTTLRHHRQRLAIAIFAAFMTFWPAVEVFAQQAPPQPQLKRSPPVWLGMAIMFILFVAVVALNLFPSKRDHRG